MLLFVNACFRAQSRTKRLADMLLSREQREDIVELNLAKELVEPLDATRIVDYADGVAAGNYTHSMFAFAAQFTQADEVIIAAPFWNYGLPAKLVAYLELVCSQGVSFDIDERGSYVSLCNINKLTFVSTAGGPECAAQDNHAFGYIKTLSRKFWHVPNIEYVAAWGLDAPNANVEALLHEAVEKCC